jgi:hypothetical protein
MRLLSTFISADKTRKSTVSIVDEQTYAVEFFHNEKLASYAYFDSAQQAEDSAEDFILKVASQ